MWAAGLAAATAAVARWGIVGPGFVWLGGGVTLLIGIPAIPAGAGAWAIAGAALTASGTAAAAHRAPASALLGLGCVMFLVAASFDGTVLASATGALLLGGITGEMMLGHWYLVDPRLPRRTLRRLDLAGGVGVALDTAVLGLLGAFPWEPADLVVGFGYILLAVTTAILAWAVWSALGEAGYPAVMAATGLSYLAVLTAIGAAVLGRLLASGTVLG